MKLLPKKKKIEHRAPLAGIRGLLRKGQRLLLSSALFLSIGLAGVSKVKAGVGPMVSSGSITRAGSTTIPETRRSFKKFADVEIIVSKKAADEAPRAKNIPSIIASQQPAATASQTGLEKRLDKGEAIRIRGKAITGTGSEGSAGSDGDSDSRNQKNSAFGAVELKEAKKEVKDSLYGLADFMKGG